MKSTLYWATITAVIMLLCGLPLQPASAAMVEMADTDMEQIHGQDGITIAIKNVQIFQFIDNFTYGAPVNEFGTCGGVFSLQNIKLVSSTGGPGLYNYDFGTLPLNLTKNGTIFLDMGVCQVASEEDWNFGTVTAIEKAYMGAHAPWWSQDAGYLIGNILLGPSCDDLKDLGSAYIGSFDLRSFDYYSAPHGDGVDFEYDLELHIDHIMYGYNDGGDILSFNNIHIGQTFGFDFGAPGGDDPADPTTWYTDPLINTSIGQFKIGDIFGDVTGGIHSNPATFDVATLGNCADSDEANHVASVINIPLEGSIRFDNVEFGPSDFGPGAIDNIHAYRLEVLLIP